MYWIPIYRLTAAVLVLLPMASAWAGPEEDQYALAATHYVRQRWQLAVDEFDAFLAQHPGDERVGAALFLTGESLVQLRRYDEAKVRFAEFLKRAPDHRFARQALFRIGEASYLTGQREDARRYLETFRENYPDDQLQAYALPYLGELALQRGEAALAQSLYTLALQKYAEGPLADECRFGTGRALEIQGDAAGALRFYQFLAASPAGSLADHAQLRIGVLQYESQQYDKARRALVEFETTYRASPLRVDARYWLGMVQMGEERWSDAAATLLSAVPAASDHPLAAACHFWAGEALRKSGDAQAAQQQYDLVLEKWPEAEWADDSLQAQIQLAFDTGDHHLTPPLADKFQQRFPNSPLLGTVEQLRGRALMKQGLYEEAAATFQRLLNSPPGNAPPGAEDDRSANSFYLSLALIGAEQFAEALASLDRVAAPQDDRTLQDAILVARASALIGLERYGEAIQPLQSYLASDPKGPDADKCRAQLAIALARQQRWNEAMRSYEQLRQGGADSSLMLPTTLFLAEAAYAAGDRNSASRLFQEIASDQNPADYVAKGLSGLAWCQFSADDPAESAETFARLLKEHPDSSLAPEAALMRGQALEKMQQFEAALTTYQLLLDKYAGSPQAAKARFRAAQLYDRLGRDREAAQLLQQLSESPGDFPQRDAVLYERAWVLADLGQADQADELFATLWRDYRGSQYWADAAYRLAERAASRKDHARAIQLADEIVRSSTTGPVLPHALYLKGQSAAAMERWSEVAPPMRQIMDRHPTSELVLPAEYWVAEASYRLGNYADAGSRFAQLAAKTKGRSDGWLGMIPLRQAQVLAHQEQWQDAFDLAKGVPARYPSFRQLYEVDYLLGRCYGSQGQFDQARAAYQGVINSPIGGQTETAAMAQWMIGETYFHQQNYPEALKAYHRVESLFAYPRWQAAALLQAGKCHDAMGRSDEASKLYSQVVGEYPNTSFTEEAAQRLQIAQQRVRRPTSR